MKKQVLVILGNVIFLPLFLLVIQPVSVFAQQTATTCFTTNVGNPQGEPVYPAGCEQGGTGEMPSADRQALLAQIKSYVNSGKITFGHENDRTGMTNGTGQVRRMDGALVTISTSVLQFYVYMVNQGYTYYVSSMIGTHSKYSASGNISRHWDGYGIDIAIINGAVVNQTSAKGEVMKFMKTLNALIGKDIVPRQVLCAGAGRNDPTVDALSMNRGVMAPGFTARYVGDHIDHVHVGY